MRTTITSLRPLPPPRSLLSHGAALRLTLQRRRPQPQHSLNLRNIILLRLDQSLLYPQLLVVILHDLLHLDMKRIELFRQRGRARSSTEREKELVARCEQIVDLLLEE